MSGALDGRSRAPGRLTRAAFWAIGLVLLAAWLGAAGVFFLLDEQRPRVIALGIALLATELAFWATALLLGLKIAQARTLIWRKVSAMFQRPPEG